MTSQDSEDMRSLAAVTGDDGAVRERPNSSSLITAPARTRTFGVCGVSNEILDATLPSTS